MYRSSLVCGLTFCANTRLSYPAIMVFGRLRTFGALNVAL